MGDKRRQSEFTKFKKMLYRQYCENMKFYGKKPLKYLEWLRSANQINSDLKK